MTRILVLGTGCPNCERLAQSARETLDALAIEGTVEKVTDITQIVSYGVMSTPALVVNGDVVVSGRVPAAEELRSLLASECTSSD